MIEAQTPNRSIKEFVQNGEMEGWDFKDLAQDLYNAEEIFRYYFFSPNSSDDYQMPQTVLGFTKDHIGTLAHYKLLPNEVGLRYQITFNTIHLDRPVWSIYETLLHEMTHLWVEENPNVLRPAKGHSSYFSAVCNEMGLYPRVGTGVHWKGADGQFERLMDRWTVLKPDEAYRVVPKDRPKENWWDIGPRPKGISTLTLYTCDTCEKPNLCKLRSGKKDLEISCRTCQGTFKPLL